MLICSQQMVSDYMQYFLLCVVDPSLWSRYSGSQLSGNDGLNRKGCRATWWLAARAVICAGRPAWDWTAGCIFLCSFVWLQSCPVLTSCEEKPLTPNGASFSTCANSNLILHWRKKKVRVVMNTWVVTIAGLMRRREFIWSSFQTD